MRDEETTEHFMGNRGTGEASSAGKLGGTEQCI
jgi:hypothetical protein